jgi:hypothetical protein
MEERRGLCVSVTILYRHPKRPDEAGMMVVASQAQVQATTERLEQRGFRVEKVEDAKYVHLTSLINNKLL